MSAVCMRLFDLHCDTLFECVKYDCSIMHNACHVDIERGKAFSPWYQCFAAWVRDKTPPQTAAAQIETMLRRAYAFEAAHPEAFHVLQSGAELAFPPPAACTAILTVENGGTVGELPQSWIDAGVKMISLTWDGENAWAQGSRGDPRCGLTASGRAAVRQMETFRILPDAAHLNRRGFWELLEMTDRPIVVSHTASAMLHPIARNLTDAQFRAVRERGGLVGLSLCPEHLGAPTLSRMIAHLEQFLSLGGEKTVALGCDLDGIEIPAAFGGIRVLETLYEQLLKRNYAESLADDIFFRNAYRFFTKQYI